MKILRFDDNIVGKMDEQALSNYIDDETNYSVVEFRTLADPDNAWAIPVVTGQKYRIHWAEGLDFEKMQVTLASPWSPTDKSVYIIHNFTDVRAKVDFIMPKGDIVPNATLLSKS